MKSLVVLSLVTPLTALSQWTQLEPNVWNGQGDPSYRSTIMVAAGAGFHSLSVYYSPSSGGAYSIYRTGDDWASDSSLAGWSYLITPQARELTRASANGMFYIHDFGPRMVRYLTATGQGSPGSLLDYSIVGPLSAVDDTVCFWMTLNESTTSDTLQVMKNSATNEFGQTLGRVIVPVSGRPTLAFRDADNGTIAVRDTTLTTRIFTTHDGGNNWEPQVSLPDVYLHDLIYLNDTIMWAVGDGGIAVRSGDAGDTWAALDLNVPEDIWSVSGYSEDSVWISGTGGLVMATGDAGNSWVDRPIPGVHVQKIQALDGAIYAYGPNGSLFHYNPMTELVELARDGALWWSMSSTGIALHPMAGESIIRVDLLDASGRCLSTIRTGLAMDLRALPTGLYVVHLTSDQRQESAKVMWSSPDP